MTCPRCTHEIEPQDAVEFIAGQKCHVLQACFDFVQEDKVVLTAAHGEVTTTIGVLQQAAITARTSEAQAVADMIDIQAQVTGVDALIADNIVKTTQIAQLQAELSVSAQSVAAVQLQLSQAQSNILSFAKERDAVKAENVLLKAEIADLKLPKP